MNCEYCNNPIPPGVTTCPACGAQVRQQPPPPPQYGQPQQTQFVPPQYGQPQQTQFVPPQYGQQPYGQPQYAGPAKSRVTYIILGLLLGGLGIHNFYAGYAGRGVAQLLITLLTSWFGGFVIIWIWVIIEICTVSVDASGRPMA